MRRLLGFGTMLCVGGLLSCDGAAVQEVPDPGVTSTPGTTSSSGWPPGELGGVHLDLGDGTGAPRLSAVFVRSAPNAINLAQCAVEGVPCLPLLPATEDTFIDATAAAFDFDPSSARTRFVGFEIDVAGNPVPYREDAETGFGFYARTLQEGEQVEVGPASLSWAGQWPAFASDDAVEVSPPVALSAPAPGGFLRFHNGEQVPIEWVPQGNGDLTLSITIDGTQTLMYLLEDDGYFELPVDDLGIPGLVADVDFVLRRWNRSTLQEFGHVVEVVATSEQRFSGEYFDIGGREELEGADRCAEATAQSPLQTGGYWGRLGWYSADTTPDTCVLPGCADGFDGIYKVEVPGRTMFQVEYNALTDSGSMYLMSDCGNENTCEGSDFDPAANAPEFLQHFNPTDDPRRFYLYVDSTADCSGTPVDTYYTLDVQLETLVEPPMYDSCVDAEDAAPTATGNYYATFVGYYDDYNPGVGGCTETNVNKADALTPVEVPSGSTLTVNISMPGGDPALYVFTDCGLAPQCAEGQDMSLGPQETLVYENTSGALQRVYVVVDSKTGLLPYLMSIQF